MLSFFSPRRPEWADAHEAHGSCVLDAHGRAARRTLPAAVRRLLPTLRNRIETTNVEITEYFALARRRAHTVWGPLARTAATSVPHSLFCLALV